MAGTVLVEETAGIATAKLLPGTAGAMAAKMAQTPSEAFRVLAKSRDEEIAAMRSLCPELLGPGRVDPTLAPRGATKGTLVRQHPERESPAAGPDRDYRGHAHAAAAVDAPGPGGHRFLAAGNRHGL